MKIGMTLPSMIAGLDRETVLAWCRAIDDGPFSSLALGERVAFDNVDMITTLAAAAAVTERVALMATISVLPLHRAAMVAKQAATIDVISGGRLIFGVGVGGREEDYNSVGAPFARRSSRLDEQVAELRRVWAGKPAPGVSPIGPAPVQPGGPPILAGAVNKRGIERAARWADGICGFSFGPDAGEVDRQFRNAERAWKEQGRSQAPRLVTGCFYALGSNPRKQMDDYVLRYMRIFGEDVARSMAAVATTTGADALRAVIARSAELGADELVLVPTTADLADLHGVAELV